MKPNLVLQSLSFAGAISSVVCIGSAVTATMLTLGLFTLSPFLSDSTELQIALNVRKSAITLGWSLLGAVGAGVAYYSCDRAIAMNRDTPEPLEALNTDSFLQILHDCRRLSALTDALNDYVPRRIARIERITLPKSSCHGCKFYSPHSPAAIYLNHPCAVHPCGIPDGGCPDYERGDRND